MPVIWRFLVSVVLVLRLLSLASASLTFGLDLQKQQLFGGEKERKSADFLQCVHFFLSYTELALVLMGAAAVFGNYRIHTASFRWRHTCISPVNVCLSVHKSGSYGGLEVLNTQCKNILTITTIKTSRTNDKKTSTLHLKNLN